MEKTTVIKALIKAKKKFTPVVLDMENPYYKSKFASLKSMKESTDEPLLENGLIVIQPCNSTPEGNILLSTQLIHEDGTSIQSDVVINRGDKTDQQIGSSLSYMRRYQYASLLNLVAETEDDGELGENRKPQTTYIKQAPTASPAREGMDLKDIQWKPAAKQKQEPVQSKENSSDKSIGKLKFLILQEDMPIDRLEEYILYRVKVSGTSFEKILETIFSSDLMLKKFFETYSAWLIQFEE